MSGAHVDPHGRTPLIPSRLRLALAIAPVALMLIAFAGSAQAAGIVNGGFESGTLEGWQVESQTEEGNWFAVSGTEPPLSAGENGISLLAPFEGTYDAVSDEVGPSSMVLYQDVALTPGASHELSLELNYRSQAAIAIPTPDSLEVAESAGPPEPDEANQQVRVDVMRAGSAVTSLEPSDILVPVFATKEGDPEEIGWTRLTANLSAFAGQTVRIRIASVDNEDFLNVGVDDVSITNNTEPAPPVTTTGATPASPTVTPVTPSCTVPKLTGKKLKAAKKKIRAAHCKVGHVGKKKGVTAKTGKVVKQSPKPGTVRGAGSKVAIRLG